jgi:lipoprotein-anchoring transpeptidase ErfK/SrfK
MSTKRHSTRHQIAALATILALVALPRVAHATEDHFDLEGDTWGAPIADDSLRIVINVPARRLTLVEGRTFVKAYPVAVGRPWTPTPRGSFRILQKAKDPTWAPKGRPAVPPGPKNPLGPRWMRISPDGYGIHATNDPGSIGKVRSHGCIRMNPADAEELFDLVPLGTPVEIVYDLAGYDDAGQPVRYEDVYKLASAE